MEQAPPGVGDEDRYRQHLQYGLQVEIALKRIRLPFPPDEFGFHRLQLAPGGFDVLRVGGLNVQLVREKLEHPAHRVERPIQIVDQRGNRRSRELRWGRQAGLDPVRQGKGPAPGVDVDVPVRHRQVQHPDDRALTIP